MKLDLSKIVLVQPPIEDYYLTKKRTLPYGLAIIAADLRAYGFDVEIVDGLASSKTRPAVLPPSFEHLSRFYSAKDISLFSLFGSYTHFGYSHQHIAACVRDKAPFVVGISSLFTAYADQALKTAELIKRFLPDCVIVMGGHHPTQFAKETLANPAVDYVIRGEGEAVFARFCLALKNKTSIDSIPGVFGKEDDLRCRSSINWIQDLSNQPIPAFDLINHKFYQRHKRGTAIVVSSRGCPMTCSYCSVSATSSHGRYRQRSVENIISELKVQLASRDIGFIDFEDENLCLDKPWFKRLFTEIKPLIEDKNIELRAMNGLFPPSLDEEVVKILKSSGFKTLNLSLGSMSRDQLKKFKRPDVRPAFKNVLALAQKNEMECVSYLIAAAPGQSAEDSLTDLMILAQKRTLIGLSIFYPAPGSLDFNICKSRGLLPEHYVNMRSSVLPISDKTSRLQAVTLLRLSRIINFLKKLVDSGIDYRQKQLISREALLENIHDRFSVSLLLLKWFLHDGQIRGLTPDGDLFTHECDTHLIGSFIEQLSGIDVCGIKKHQSNP